MNVNAILSAAAAHRAAGRLADAAETLSIALSRDAHAHSLRYELALIEAQRGNFDIAEALARSAAVAGGDVYARGLGHILARNGNLDEAERWLIRAVKLDSRDAWAHANLGAVYGDQRKLEQAIVSMQRALSIEPGLEAAKSAIERMSAERDFLNSVRSTYAAFAARNGLNVDPEEAGDTEIEFPSATLDESGKPRFVMQVPASLIVNDLGAAHLFHREVTGQGYEFALRRFLDVQLRSDDVFIDVGAHWGIHALTAATRLPREVSVLSIEAHPVNAERLRKWVARNHLESDVEVIAAAIADHVGRAHMRVNASSMGHSLGAEGIEVDMTTIDGLLADRSWLRWRRIFLKLDVEGYEMEALAGARELLSTCDVAAVIWEIGEFHPQAEQQNRNQVIFDTLHARGFEHFRFEDERVGGVLVPLGAKPPACNVFSLSPTIRKTDIYARA